MYAWYFSWLPLKLCLMALSRAFWMSSSVILTPSWEAMFSNCAFCTSWPTIGATSVSWYSLVPTAGIFWPFTWAVFLASSIRRFS